MSREIKFRAWDKLEKKMLVGKQTNGIMLRDGHLSNLYLDYIYLQYTGLKDKNGKEGYEFDIVAPNYLHKYPAVIKWDNDNAQFILESKDNISDFEMYEQSDLEIIGNIYENKELLK